MKKLTVTIITIIFPIVVFAQWVQTNLNPGIGYCLYSDGRTIYAGTDQGVYYTNDLGDPWFSIGPNDLIFAVLTAGDTIIAGSGTGHGIWLSNDQGSNWIGASVIDSNAVYALCKKDKYLFAGSWAGGVFRSNDRGKSWQKVGLDGEPVEAIFATNNIILASGMGNEGARVFFSIDDGDSWEYRELPYPTSRIHCFTEKNDRLFAGTDGGLYSSNDLGDSWTFEYGVTFDSSGNVIDVKMFKELQVYDQYLISSILFNSIWLSQDDGKTWRSFNEGLITDWNFEGLAVQNTNLWALRSMFGNAYRRPISELISSLVRNKSVIPDQIIFNQNYPNPFNPSTTIEFTLPRPEYTTLKVYNILGTEVASLVSDKLQAGGHKYQFDGSKLASGVYYYQVTAGTFRDVKKMILLR